MTAVKNQTLHNFILKRKCHITPALPKWPLPQTGAITTHAMLIGIALDDTTLSTGSMVRFPPFQLYLLHLKSLTSLCRVPASRKQTSGFGEADAVMAPQ